MNAPVTPMVSAALGRVLESDRYYYNAQLIALRSRRPSLEFEAIKTFLVSAIDPIAEAVEAVDSGRCRFVVQACFQHMLALGEHGLLGSDLRSSYIAKAWRELIPALTTHIIPEPRAVLAWVTNAVDRIGTTPGARVEGWIAGMLNLARHLESVEHVRIAGQVLAWRAGLAHYRRGALRLALTLPDAAGKALFPPDVAANWRAAVERHANEPWWHFGTNEEQVAPPEVRVGAFAGWGGAFVQPPQLRAGAEGFWVSSHERYHHLVADCYGAVLLASTHDHFHTASAHSASPKDIRTNRGHIETSKGRWPIPVPEQGLVVTAGSDTVAVTSPWSHHIWLYPR